MSDERAETAQPTPTMPSARTARSGWDFTLMVATVSILGALGLQSLIGTLYAWWAYRTQPDWETAGGYASFIDVMNAVAAPLVIALVLVMGLCVPKRLFSRRALTLVSVAMLALGAIVGAVSRSVVTGLATYLGAAALVQLAVVVLTLRGAGRLAYLSSSRVAKAGSGLLHLGFIGFAIVVVALQDSPAMLPVFFASAVLLTGGSAMSFYARPVAEAPEEPAD